MKDYIETPCGQMSTRVFYWIFRGEIMKDYIETPCGQMSTRGLREEYEAMSDQQICDLINGEFVDPFALAEMKCRPNIVLVDSGRKAEVRNEKN